MQESADRANKRAWTWCHWQTSIPAWKLLRVSEIAVRAFDEGLNTQPENITWCVSVATDETFEVSLNLFVSGTY